MFAEKMLVRLGQVQSIPYPDVLHLYEAAFRGFGELYAKVGYFGIKEDMIGVNRQGHVKVWLHTDWSNDRPDKDAGSQARGEVEMVH